MKYDFLILSSLPKNSGCYLRARYLAHALEQNNRRVKIITPFSSKPFMLDFLMNFLKYFFCVLFISYRTGLAIKPYPNTLLPLFLKKILVHNKVIVDIDDIDFGYRKGLISTISRLLQRPFPRFGDGITYHNFMLRDFIKKEYRIPEMKLHVLKQGVDFSVFHAFPKVRELKKKFIHEQKILKTAKILIYTAHLNIASDLDIILSRLKPALDQRAFLIIAGGGPLLGAYKKLAQKLHLKNIYFTGYLSPHQIVQYTLMADYALVFYQDKEVNYYRSSMKLREYLALKKKIICNDIGELKAFKNYTYQSKAGIQDFLILLQRLLLKRPSDNRELKGYRFVKRCYDWKTIAREFLSELNHGI